MERSSVHRHGARRSRAWLGFGLAGLLSACSGTVGSGEPTPDSTPTPARTGGTGGRPAGTGGMGGMSVAPPDKPTACAATLGTTPLRRLTTAEYLATIKSLLGDDGSTVRSLLIDDAHDPGRFVNDVSYLDVSDQHADRYLQAAEALASKHAPALVAAAGCAGGGDACATKFIESFGRRAFRRPLDAAEKSRYLAVFAAGKQQKDDANGLRLVVQALLQSPKFLYRIDLGTPVTGRPGLMKLTSHEVASRLSYLLTGDMPDATLSAAADAGALVSRDQVLTQARRLLDGAAADRGVRDFHLQWLEIDKVDSINKDTTVYPAWTPELAKQAKQETSDLARGLVGGSVSFETFLGGEHVKPAGALGQLYGAGGPTQRRGVLTHVSVLAALSKENQSNPVRRAAFVREQILCAPPPPPPIGVDVTVPPIRAGATTRERFAQHSQDPQCAPCHKLLDPIGFGFERYDGIGAYREREEGRPIDASGEMVASGETALDGRFDGVPELAARLGRSETAARCYVTQWYRYALGRHEQPEDRCTLDALTTTFRGNGQSPRELLLALVTSDAFLYRKAPGSEVSP